jgi:pimeloyl-ACP methyl ester carboxylesterase
MTARNISRLCLVLIVTCLLARADNPVPGKNRVWIRGQEQEVYFLPGAGVGPHRRVLFIPGDGGWHGFAIDIGDNLSAAGYDVLGLDTRRYLQSFTGESVLTTTQIASDFRQLADWIRQGGHDRVLLAGWSEGAGLGLAAAADGASKSVFEGLVAIGMTEQNILAWRYSDLWAEVSKKLPKEPTFASSEYVSKVAPLPLFVIASTRDEYISQNVSRTLFGIAREPKRFVLIDARDHKFSGNTDQFFRTFKEALSWTVQQHK